jgi:hypothetical protein
VAARRGGRVHPGGAGLDSTQTLERRNNSKQMPLSRDMVSRSSRARIEERVLAVTHCGVKVQVFMRIQTRLTDSCRR